MPWNISPWNCQQYASALKEQHCSSKNKWRTQCLSTKFILWVPLHTYCSMYVGHISSFTEFHICCSFLYKLLPVFFFFFCTAGYYEWCRTIYDIVSFAASTRLCSGGHMLALPLIKIDWPIYHDVTTLKHSSSKYSLISHYFVGFSPHRHQWKFTFGQLGQNLSHLSFKACLEHRTLIKMGPVYRVRHEQASHSQEPIRNSGSLWEALCMAAPIWFPEWNIFLQRCLKDGPAYAQDLQAATNLTLCAKSWELSRWPWGRHNTYCDSIHNAM